MKKCIAYIDILGSKNSFLGENPNQGIQKIEYLIQIIEEQLTLYPTLTACNFSDSFVLYGEEEDLWTLKSVVGHIFRNYFFKNKLEAFLLYNNTFLLRGGLSVGDIHEISITKNNFRAFYGTGLGLISAYQTSEISKGHRIFLNASFLDARKNLFPPKGTPGLSKTVKPFYELNANFSELAWYDSAEIIELIYISRYLLNKSIEQYKQTESDNIIKHYTLTLTQLLTCCRDIPTLLDFTRYHISKKDHHHYVWPVWCSAWVSLMHPKLRSDLPMFREIIWASFVNCVSKSRFSNKIFEYLKHCSVFHPFHSFLYIGKFEDHFMNSLTDDKQYQETMAKLMDKSKLSSGDEETNEKMESP